MDYKKTSLTLATYNIHSCIGRDGIFDPDRIIDVIRQLDADIIALQEVESPYNSLENLIDTFSEKTGMQIIPGHTIVRETSSYGNAILTRREITDIHHINISVKSRESRGVIRFMVQWGGLTIHIIATHLGLRRHERRIQAQHLLKEFKRHPSDISVLMGDLNEWQRWGKPLRQLRKHFNDIQTPATFPAHYPVFSLDRILVQPRSYLQSIGPVKNKLTRMASDHLPLKATLSF